MELILAAVADRHGIGMLHTDPKFTLRVYTHIMRRGLAERARLKALVNGDPIELLELATSQRETPR